MNSELYFIGVDGGGSCCRVCFEFVDGILLVKGQSGLVNVMCSLDIVCVFIMDVIVKVIEVVQLFIMMQQIVLCVGLVGVNIVFVYQVLMVKQLLFKYVYLISDFYVVCVGVYVGYDGVVIVCGMGLLVICYVFGSFIDFGGYGFFIGDKVSGVWFGL